MAPIERSRHPRSNPKPKRMKTPKILLAIFAAAVAVTSLSQADVKTLIGGVPTANSISLGEGESAKLVYSVAGNSPHTNFTVQKDGQTFDLPALSIAKCAGL